MSEFDRDITTDGLPLYAQRDFDRLYGRFLSLVQQTGGANIEFEFSEGELDPQMLALIDERSDLRERVGTYMAQGLEPSRSVVFPRETSK